MCYRNALHIKMKKTLLSRSFLLFYFRLCERCSRYICPKVGNISWGKGRGKQEDLGEEVGKEVERGREGGQPNIRPGFIQIGSRRTGI